METVSPASVGASTKRLKFMDSAMQRYVDEGKVAGIVTVLSRRGQVFHVGCYGMADRENAIPMQTDTIFRIWSVTKAITAVAVLMLYEEGEFVLDQDITDFIPSFKNTRVYVGMDGDQPELVDKERPITIRQLLTHSAGIPFGFSANMTYPEQAMQKYMTTLKQPGTELKELVDKFAEIPLVAQPNTLWHYGMGFELLARLVEIVSGQCYQNFLRDRIFEPLGMVDANYVLKKKDLPRMSALYRPREDGTIERCQPPEDEVYVTRNGRVPPGYWTPGGAGLDATPADLLRFAHMLYHRGTVDGVRILAPTTVELMASNHLPPALIPYRFSGAQPMYGYGHGLGVHTLTDHGLAGLPCANGEFWKDGGAGTLFWVDPRNDLVGLVMYQLHNFWIHPIYGKARAIAYQALE
ncbi:MAG: beta-lactamase family protein [Armatimonadetes bacterium]|nr:class A beta-lactamase-related serine hydrolase [Chloroflexota bacterium]MBL1153239.1 class A beta-lactamase-related serine hydrolase [Armatimonadota bacterium]NOG39896.1 beta-lactamase family protein [Armatimonadota bacterium]NOG66468.1 beta-lactamase family protein [Chloroflexota bacterium]